MLRGEACVANRSQDRARGVLETMVKELDLHCCMKHEIAAEDHSTIPPFSITGRSETILGEFVPVIFTGFGAQGIDLVLNYCGMVHWDRWNRCTTLEQVHHNLLRFFACFGLSENTLPTTNTIQNDRKTKEFEEHREKILENTAKRWLPMERVRPDNRTYTICQRAQLSTELLDQDSGRRRY
eukprot:2966156-Amphidinium_carterae.1